MGSLTNFAELELLDHVFTAGAYTPAATLYIGLLTADPTEAGTYTTEPSGNGYAREEISFEAATGRSVTQAALVTFNECDPAGWGTLTHFGIFDALTDGNMLAYGALTTSIVTVAGNIPFIPDEATVISVDAGGASNYLANKLLDFMFRNQAYTQPDLYVCMCDADPTDAGTGTSISEPTGNYVRKEFTDWTTAAAGSLNNDSAIVFATPTVNWPTITHTCIVDASTVGNMLCYTTATPNQAPLIDDPVQYPATDYIITMD